MGMERAGRRGKNWRKWWIWGGLEHRENDVGHVYIMGDRRIDVDEAIAL